MTDVLGPAAAGAPRAIASSDPSITATIQFPDAADTWFQDCVNNTAGTGTPYVAEWANRQLQQIRRVIRNSGVSLTYADDQLGYAIQQGLRWVGSFGGTANALLATMVPAQPTLVAGTEIKGLITATNTGSATLNVNGLGALPIALPDGTPLTGAEMVIGGVASLIYTGSSFVLLAQSLLGFQRIIQANTTFFVNNSTGNDSSGDGLTPATAWFSIAHAIKVLATYNLNGNTITIQLANTGVNYAAPFAFNAPSNGTLVINGDSANQANYTIAGAPTAGQGVVAPSFGSIKIVGLRISNTGSAALSNGVLVGSASCSLQNVTFLNTNAAVSSHIATTVGGAATINSGVIISGSCVNALQATNGGSIIQAANASVLSTSNFTGAFCSASVGGAFTVSGSGLSWSGTAIGLHYSASLNGVIFTGGGGAAFFPGGTPGSTSTGGQYG